jgi:hypothetical protein
MSVFMKKYFSITTIVKKLAYIGVFLFSSLNAGAQGATSDFYREPGLSPNRSYINQSANEHIDPFTGALQRQYVDLHLPGNGGFDLKIIRSYNSAAVDLSNPTSNSALADLSGPGWKIHFGRILTNNSLTVCQQPKLVNEGGLTFTPENLTLELPDGSRQTLVWNEITTGPIVRWSPQRWMAVCDSSIGLMSLSVFAPNGMRYNMTPMRVRDNASEANLGWHTTSIYDRNSNYASINYSATSILPEITSITTKDGRSVSFDYFDQGLMNRRLKSISSAGQTYYYNYSGRIGGNSDNYFLTSVTRPDGTSWKYTYNDYFGSSAYGSYMLKRVITPQGGSIDYYYSSMVAETDWWGETVNRATVVSKKLSSDGGTWTFTYPTRKIGELDTTIVDGPSGRTEYKHIGPNYATSGSLWTIGLLRSKTIGNTQTESYTWDKLRISGQRIAKGTGFYTKYDDAFYAPVLSQKTIYRDGANYSTTYSNYDTFGNVGTADSSTKCAE